MSNIISQKQLSIVIPAYNEEFRIGITLREVYDVAKMTLDEFEIIVVNDGSTDGTCAKALVVANELGPEVSVISNKQIKVLGLHFIKDLSLQNSHNYLLFLVIMHIVKQA